MASEYTQNRRYPLYTDNDKPNLRDQYNGAIREIDSDMADALRYSRDVYDALGSGFDSDHTVSAAVGANSTAITNEAEARSGADNTINGRIDTLSTALTEESTARANADNALSARIDAMNTLGHAIYIGNSFAQGVGSTSGNNGLYALTRGLFSSYHLNSTGGAGFGTYTGHPTTFYDLLVEAAGWLSAEEKAELTHVIFISAVGDTHALAENPESNGVGYDSTWLKTAFTQIDTYVKNTFPNARVYIFNADQQKTPNVGSPANLSFSTSYKLHTMFKELCNTVGFVYSGWAGYNTTYREWWIADDIHPNDYGYKRLASMLTEFLLFGKPVEYKTETTVARLPFTTSTNEIIYGKIHVVANIDGTAVYVEPPVATDLDGKTISAGSHADVVSLAAALHTENNYNEEFRNTSTWITSRGWPTGTPTSLIGVKFSMITPANLFKHIGYRIDQDFESRYGGLSYLTPSHFYLQNEGYQVR